MLRFSSAALMLIVFSIASINLEGPLQESSGTNENSTRLDGAYEFVSESTVLTGPKPLTKRRVADEWQGLWFFQGDRFSQTIMKKGRLYSAYPKFHEELGYDSSAGTFAIDGNRVRFKQQIELRPKRAGASVTATFKIDGDLLTLIETMSPYPEDLSRGERVTVLRKVK